MKSRYKVTFAAHPLGIVGRSAGQRRVEKRLAETSDVDHDRELSRSGDLAQLGSEPPCNLFIKAQEVQFSFLCRNHRQVILA